MILSYAPYEALLVLRVTSREFNDRVQRLFMDHIIVQNWYFSGPEELSERGAFLTKHELRQLPDLLCDDRALDTIRVLDLNAMTFNGLADAVNCGFIGPLSPTWLRTRGDPWFGFADDHVSATFHVHFLLAAPYRSWHRFGQTYLPREVVKTVINFESDCLDLADAGSPRIRVSRRIRVAKESLKVKHLVFIRNPRTPVTSTTLTDSSRLKCVASNHSKRWPQATLATFVGAVARQYWWNGAPCHVTLVGFPLECIAPELFADNVGLPPSTEDVRISCIQKICDMYDNWDRRVSPFASVAEVKKRLEEIEIIDHETYCRRVGENVYRLETVW